jgi:hypothetical protein
MASVENKNVKWMPAQFFSCWYVGAEGMCSNQVGFCAVPMQHHHITGIAQQYH